MEPHCHRLLLNIIHGTAQDAIEQKNPDKEAKLREAEKTKAETASKKNATTVVDMFSSPSLLLFEEATNNFNKTHTTGQHHYLSESARLLLERVKDLVETASDSMLGKGPLTIWSMEEIKHASNDMVAKTRIA